MISYYELLNMIKEDKAPKEIKYRGVIYKAMYDCGEFSYYYIKNVKEINEDCKDYFAECFLESDMFYKDIEIIDKIEKLNIYQEKNCKNNWKWKCNNYNISAPQKIIADKVNEIIDKLEKMEK